MEIKLTAEDKIKVANTDQVFDIMQGVLKREQYLDLGKEHLWVIGMENNNRLLFLELISLGCVTETTIHPPDMFRVAILKNATKMIVCHNHPSGEVEPSDPDIEHTDKLIQMGKFLRVEIVDHMIFCTESFYSFAKEGLIQRLKYSTKYLLNQELRAKLEKDYQILRLMAHDEGKEEGIEIGLEKGLKVGQKDGRMQEKLEMAKKMKSEGEPLEKIINYTGLTQKDIEDL